MHMIVHVCVRVVEKEFTTISTSLDMIRYLVIFHHY